MTNTRPLKGTFGSYWDVVTLLAYGEERNNVLLVSDRTLYLLNNLSLVDVHNLNRYYLEKYANGYAAFVDEFDAEAVDIADVANNVGLELFPVTDIRAVVSATMYTTWATQEVPNNTLQKVAFQVTDHDTGGIANLGSDMLTAPRDGRYVITGSVEWAAQTGGIRRAFIRRNGQAILYDKRQPFGSVPDVQVVAGSVWLEEGDQVTLEVLQNSGVSVNVVAVGDVRYYTSLGMVGF